MSRQRITDFLNRLCFAFVRYVIWPICPAQFIVLLGGPGAGKGTLAKLLVPFLGLAHLSTGDVFRRERDNKTELGLKIQAYIDAGKLVPDEITIAVLRKELMRWKYRRGAILDGIPRTLTQAKLLDELLFGWGQSVNAVVLLDPDEAVLIERLSFRLTCTNKACGRTYHLHTKPPKVPGICDACKSPLYQRKDDSKEVIPERLSTYRRESAPICEHYGRGLVVVKPTLEETEQDVFNEVTTALRARRS
jgi:adenylate kinase